MPILRIIALTTLLSFTATAAYATDEPFIENISEYLEFATYEDGVMTIAQLDAIGHDNVTLINTSSEDGFEESMIPGSIHIDWREVLEQKHRIPTDKIVVVYCKNSLVSARAQLLLRLAGYDNVRILSRGYNGWKAFQSNQTKT